MSLYENAYKKMKYSKPIVKLCATNEMQTIFINENKTSWIKLTKLPEPHALTMPEFEEMWSKSVAS